MTTKKKDFINILNKIEPLFNETGFNYKIKVSHPAIEHIFEKEIINNKIREILFEQQKNNYYTNDLGLITDAVATSSTGSIDTVAGKITEIGRLGTADAVADLAILATTDVVSDMNTLATADIVSDMNTQVLVLM